MNNEWKLTDREQDVMRLLTTTPDSSNKAVGRKLGISDKTVAVYVDRACEKMGVKSRLQAALLWDREFHRGITIESCGHCQGLGYIRREAA